MPKKSVSLVAPMLACSWLLCTIASAVHAQNETTALLPDQYRTSASIDLMASEPRTIERASAVSGTDDFIVAPIFGSGTSTSFLRLANPTSLSANYTIRVVGSPSGNLYGTAIYSVPAYASPQYAYSQILTAASTTAPQGSDDSYSFYVRSSNTQSGFQHVLYNDTNKFFENVSVCTWGAATNYTALNRAVVNAHTTTLAAYPTVILIHNYAATSGNYRLSVYESSTGTPKGTYDFSVVANGTYATPVSFFQTQVGWQPTSSDRHANFVFEATGSTTYSLTVGQAITNDALGAVINMSQICGLNSGAVASSVVVIPTATHLVSEITSNFTGFSYNRTYNLLNGQVWRQTSFEISFSFLFFPDVVIWPSGASYKMSVDGEDDWITVVRVQ